MLNNIKNIIFDFGGVLIDIDYNATIQAFKDLGIENFDQLYSKAQQSNLFNDIEVGNISEEDFVSSLLQYLPERTSSESVIDAWNKMILRVPIYSIELLHSLKEKGYKLFMLSNTNAIHINKALNEWHKVSESSPREIFDHVYLSHEINLRKPNKEVFEFVCQKENINPGETLFIDDSIQHIEGAKGIGLKTFHLTEESSLQELFS